MDKRRLRRRSNRRARRSGSAGPGRRQAPRARRRARARHPRRAARRRRPTCTSATPTRTRSPRPARRKEALADLKDSGIGNGAIAPIETLVAERDAAKVVDGRRPACRGRARRGRAGRGGLAPRAALALVSAVPREGDDMPGRAATRSQEVIDAAHARLARRARVGGTGPLNADFIDAVYGSFPLMIALISLLTFLLLARAFRSLLLPLKAVILNVLSVGAAWGVMTLVWQAGPRLGGDLGDRGHRLDRVVDPADGLRVPVRAVDGLRGVHPRPHARGVRPHRRHRTRP